MCFTYKLSFATSPGPPFFPRGRRAGTVLQQPSRISSVEAALLAESLEKFDKFGARSPRPTLLLDRVIRREKGERGRAGGGKNEERC